LALAAYAVQLLVLRILTVPWYLPAAGSFAVVLMVLSLLQARSTWRIAGLIFVCLLAGFEWWFLLFFTRLPPYTGPVARGKPFPRFTTTLADGSSFNQNDLRGKENTVMVFFRGRW
jgi:hypothetical protein